MRACFAFVARVLAARAARRDADADEHDSCIVCLEPCATRACACSRMHRGCCERMLRHRTECSVCGRRYAIERLQRQPLGEPSREYEALLRRTFVAHRRKRRLLGRWSRETFPLLLRFLKRHRFQRRTVLDCFEVIVLDERNELAFEQFLMSHGYTARDACTNVSVIRQLHETWETLPSRTRGRIEAAFRGSTPTASDERAWEVALTRRPAAVGADGSARERAVELDAHDAGLSHRETADVRHEAVGGDVERVRPGDG